MPTPPEAIISAERIYIVDDEITISKLLETWVGQRWGYTTKVFEDGKSFLNQLTELPDLVLLDLMLPNINGVDLLKEIKRRSPNLPVIVLSAQGSVDVAITTLKFGAADYFSKPIDFPRLEIAIKNSLKLASLSREVENLRESVTVCILTISFHKAVRCRKYSNLSIK